MTVLGVIIGIAVVGLIVWWSMGSMFSRWYPRSGSTARDASPIAATPAKAEAAMRCGRCSAPTEPGARFCGTCGSPVDGPTL
jgi:hypothetical protein